MSDIAIKLRALAGEWFECCNDIHEPLGEAADRISALEAENAKLREALLGVVYATRAYLPPDGISAKECLNRILSATDNAVIAPLILEIENGNS